MSVTLGTTFKETLIICWGLQEQIGGGKLSEEDKRTAEKTLEYLRRNLWHIYPYQCLDCLDQRVDDKPFSVTMLSEEEIKKNVAHRELEER